MKAPSFIFRAGPPSPPAAIVLAMVWRSGISAGSVKGSYPPASILDRNFMSS